LPGRIRVLLIGLVLAAACLIPSAQTPSAEAQSVWVRMRAYKVDVAFWTPTGPLNAYEAHFGAFFGGYSCRDYSYLGAGGGPPAPNWWGPTYSVALLSKTWLYSWNPGGYHWDPNKHEALCHI
jgi:hypothetical protein